MVDLVILQNDNIHTAHTYLSMYKCVTLAIQYVNGFFLFSGLIKYANFDLTVCIMYANIRKDGGPG